MRGVPIDPKDADGNLVAPMLADVVITNGTPPMLDAVMLTPRPVCADGIDNDGDGRVDVDDPQCIDDPNSATE